MNTINPNPSSNNRQPVQNDNKEKTPPVKKTYIKTPDNKILELIHKPKDLIDLKTKPNSSVLKILKEEFGEETEQISKKSLNRKIAKHKTYKNIENNNDLNLWNHNLSDQKREIRSLESEYYKTMERVKINPSKENLLDLVDDINGIYDVENNKISPDSKASYLEPVIKEALIFEDHTKKNTNEIIQDLNDKTEILNEALGKNPLYRDIKSKVILPFIKESYLNLEKPTNLQKSFTVK